MGPRYAIYYGPAPTSDLWRFGSGLIGYDAATGSDTEAADPLPFPEWRALTEEPRRYGFHATLKAPFSLRSGLAERDLVAAATGLAARQVAVTMPRLTVQGLGTFVALGFAERSAAVDALAAASVHAFEPLRAALSAEDRARRLRSPLSSQQAKYLDRFGYPYVLDEFRFHMTLTGPLPPELRPQVRDVLAERWAAIEEELTLDALSVVRQQTRSERFRVIARYPLLG